MLLETRTLHHEVVDHDIVLSWMQDLPQALQSFTRFETSYMVSSAGTINSPVGHEFSQKSKASVCLQRPGGEVYFSRLDQVLGAC